MASNTFLLSHYFQAPQITARDILEDAESEFRDYGQHMVEYVGLNAFVGNPVFHGGEEIKFDRNTGFCRLQLADHASQFLTDLREAFQIIDQVGAKHTYIRLSTAVYADGIIDPVRLVLGVQFFFFLVDIVCQQGNFAEFGQHLRRTETHAVHIDIDGALDPPSGRF